jgi:hypothetical protein
MPFRFMVDARSIECDTVNELRQAIELLDSPLPRSAPATNSQLLDPLLTDPLPRRKRRYTRKPPVSGQSKSWDEARREARRQGRDDISKVRSELAQARRAEG